MYSTVGEVEERTLTIIDGHLVCDDHAGHFINMNNHFAAARIAAFREK
jgi:hypothetical protein